MAVQNDFSKGSILSHMARIALPMTLAQFVNILYNIIDITKYRCSCYECNTYHIYGMYCIY